MSKARKTRLPSPPESETAAGKVTVAYLTPREMSAAFHDSLLNLWHHDLNHNGRLFNGGGRIHLFAGANLSSKRNQAVQQFLDETNAEWLWFIDADMTFEPDTLDRLLARGEEGIGVVGGLCFGHTDDLVWPTLYQLMPDPGGSDRKVMARATDYPDGELVKVDATGAACLLLHRNVLTAMRAAAEEGREGFHPAFPWFQETALHGTPCGEDITFCLRAGYLGFPIVVDTGIHIGHEKTRYLTHDMFRAQQREGATDGTGNLGAGEDAPADHAGQ